MIFYLDCFSQQFEALSRRPNYWQVLVPVSLGVVNGSTIIYLEQNRDLTYTGRALQGLVLQMHKDSFVVNNNSYTFAYTKKVPLSMMRFKAILTQSGTSAPVIANTLINTLGEIPTFTRISAGVYTINVVAGIFIRNNMFVLIGGTNPYITTSTVIYSTYLDAGNLPYSFDILASGVNNHLTDGSNFYIDIIIV